jgi:hypothetical protein
MAGTSGDAARSLLGHSATLIWSVEAASHFEAMTLYYDHMGWGEYATEHEWIGGVTPRTAWSRYPPSRA